MYGVRPGDQLGERRVGQPLGQRPGRVAGEAPVQVLAVLGDDERAARPERGDVEHRHGPDAAAELALLQVARSTPGPRPWARTRSRARRRSRSAAGRPARPASSTTGTSRPARSRLRRVTVVGMASSLSVAGEGDRRPAAAVPAGLGGGGDPQQVGVAAAGGPRAGGWPAGRAPGPGSRWPAARSGCTGR